MHHDSGVCLRYEYLSRNLKILRRLQCELRAQRTYATMTQDYLVHELELCAAHLSQSVKRRPAASVIVGQRRMASFKRCKRFWFFTMRAFSRGNAVS